MPTRGSLLWFDDIVTKLHAPAAGTIGELADLPTDIPLEGDAIVVELGELDVHPSTVVVAPLGGTITEVDASGFVVIPDPDDVTAPRCEAVVVQLVGGDPEERRVVVDVEDVVAAGQEIMRFKPVDDVLLVVEIVGAHGALEVPPPGTRLYAAEPLARLRGA